MKYVLFIAAAFTLSCLSLLLPSTTTYAKDEVQVTLSPVSDEIELEPHQQYTRSITVLNSGKQSFKFTVYVRPYSVADERYTPLFEGDSSHTQLRRWITLSKYTYELQPQQKVDIPYTITTPASLPDGGQYAAIFAETTGEKNDDNNLVTKKRVGTILYSHTKGKTTFAGSSSISLPPRFTAVPRYTMDARVINTGNVDFKATATITVSDYFSRKQLYTASIKKPVLPGTTRLISLPWQDESSFFSMYRVSQTVAYLNRQDTSNGVLVVISPPAVFLTLLALLIVLLLGWWSTVLLRRHYRYKKHVQAHGSDTSSKKSAD